ncbi:MAG: lipid A biosynthesis acyltransferase [Flavobacteriaceae bacterium]|nr:lipid A biosynthesis acyltransferase [Flavobacteriaceae bacterium]
MAKWDGKSKGTPLGYKIFIFIIRKIGIKSAYFVLYFVAFYYLLFSREGTQASYLYFRKRRKQTWGHAILSVYKTNFVFGQTIIDKVAIRSGLKNKFSFKSKGNEIIENLLKEKKGGILISAHIGNFELSDFFFTEVDSFSQVCIVTTDNEHAAIKKQINKSNKPSTTRFIIIKDDFSHIFEINNALKNNNLICFTGDRYMEGSKTVSGEFLHKEASFPAGPFMLGARLQVPVLFVYVMKHSSQNYRLYAERATFKHRDTKGLLTSYIKSMESVLKKYPYQWFNFFDFWNDLK